MMDCFLEMLSRFYPARFGVLFCSVVLDCRYPHENYWTAWSVVPVFLTRGGFEYNISHRRSVTVLCMLNKIICNPVRPLCIALPAPYVPVRVTRGALDALRYTYSPSRCRTSQHRSTFIPLSVSLWNDLAGLVFDGMGLTDFKRFERYNCRCNCIVMM